MAIEDMFIDAQMGVAEVYPISTRHLLTSYARVENSIFYEDLPGTWPPEDSTQTQRYVFFSSEIEGYGALGPEDAHHYDPVNPYYAPESTTYQRYWSAGHNALRPSKSIAGGFGIPSLPIYECGVSLLYFDLTGLPGGVTGAELVVDLESWGDGPGIDDDRSLLADYHDTYATGPEGEPVTTHDDYTSEDPEASVIPEIKLSEMSWAGDPAPQPLRYPDVLGRPEDVDTRWALPLFDDGGFVAGAFRGVRLMISGGEPQFDNHLQIFSRFSLYDDAISAGVSLRDAARFNLPHLRLWLASDVYIAGEATIGMAAEGALRPEQPQIVNHLARLRRDQR